MDEGARDVEGVVGCDSVDGRVGVACCASLDEGAVGVAYEGSRLESLTGRECCSGEEGAPPAVPVSESGCGFGVGCIEGRLS